MGKCRFSWRAWLWVLLGGWLAGCQQPTPTPMPAQPTVHQPDQPAAAIPALETAVSEPTATAASPYPIAPTATLSGDVFLPLIGFEQAAPATPPIPPTPAAAETAVSTPPPPLDFAAITTQLQTNGQELVYTPIGFHTGIGGRWDGLVNYMTTLDAAGIPFFLKTADNAEPLYIAQQLMKQSGVPHTLVFRRAAGGDAYNVPPYDLPPEQAAEIHWQNHVVDFPPELDPALVWFETINEPDKNQAEWLAQFAYHTAQLALRDGYKWAAFGWASGEPEPEDWETPAMLDFLRLAGEHPDQIAIALHEYSYLVDEIGHEYPYKIGRFQELLRICDKYGIPRPTILITEWGWTYEDVPPPEQALQDIEWASRLYGYYPEVKGAAVWFLGEGNFQGIAEKTQQLILPLRDFALQHYFVRPASRPVPVVPELFRP